MIIAESSRRYKYLHLLSHTVSLSKTSLNTKTCQKLPDDRLSPLPPPRLCRRHRPSICDCYTTISGPAAGEAALLAVGLTRRHEIVNLGRSRSMTRPGRPQGRRSGEDGRPTLCDACCSSSDAGVGRELRRERLEQRVG